jgi:hypothetical protein
LGYDRERIKDISINNIARDIGVRVSGNAARCINPGNHKNGDRHPTPSRSNRNNFKRSLFPERQHPPWLIPWQKCSAIFNDTKVFLKTSLQNSVNIATLIKILVFARRSDRWRMRV